LQEKRKPGSATIRCKGAVRRHLTIPQTRERRTYARL